MVLGWNWQILSSLKNEYWWYHLKGLFLSFQKIRKSLKLDPRKSSYSSWKSSRTIDYMGDSWQLNIIQHNCVTPISLQCWILVNLMLWLLGHTILHTCTNSPYLHTLLSQVFTGSISHIWHLHSCDDSLEGTVYSCDTTSTVSRHIKVISESSSSHFQYTVRGFVVHEDLA